MPLGESQRLPGPARYVASRLPGLWKGAVAFMCDPSGRAEDPSGGSAGPDRQGLLNGRPDQGQE